MKPKRLAAESYFWWASLHSHSRSYCWRLSVLDLLGRVSRNIVSHFFTDNANSFSSSFSSTSPCQYGDCDHLYLFNDTSSVIVDIPQYTEFIGNWAGFVVEFQLFGSTSFFNEDFAEDINKPCPNNETQIPLEAGDIYRLTTVWDADEAYLASPFRRSLMDPYRCAWTFEAAQEMMIKARLSSEFLTNPTGSNWHVVAPGKLPRWGFGP